VVPLPPTLIAGVAVALLAGCLVTLLVLAPALRLAASLVGRLPKRLAWGAAPLVAAAQEIRRLETRRVLVPALRLSVLLRLAKYGAYYALLQALLVGQGQAWGDLDFLRVFLSVLGAELVASLPLPPARPGHPRRDGVSCAVPTLR